MCKTTKDMPDPNDNMMYDRDKGELVWMNRLCSLLYAVGESCMYRRTIKLQDRTPSLPNLFLSNPSRHLPTADFGLTTV